MLPSAFIRGCCNIIPQDIFFIHTGLYVRAANSCTPFPRMRRSEEQFPPRRLLRRRRPISRGSPLGRWSARLARPREEACGRRRRPRPASHRRKQSMVGLAVRFHMNMSDAYSRMKCMRGAYPSTEFQLQSDLYIQTRKFGSAVSRYANTRMDCFCTRYACAET